MELWWYISRIRPAGAALALAVTLIGYVLFWFVVSGWRRAGRWSALTPFAGLGVMVAALAGIIIFDPSITLAQIPLQKTVDQWMTATFGNGLRYFMAAPAILVTGLVQEPAKVIAALLGLLWPAGRRGARGGAPSGSAPSPVRPTAASKRQLCCRWRLSRLRR